LPFFRIIIIIFENLQGAVIYFEFMILNTLAEIYSVEYII